VFASYDDHRLVMAAAVLGLAVPGIEVENPATVARLSAALSAGPAFRNDVAPKGSPFAFGSPECACRPSVATAGASPLR